MNDRNIEPNPILQTITQVGVSLMYEKFYRRRLVAPAGKGQLRPSEREASIVQFGEALGRLTGKKKRYQFWMKNEGNGLLRSQTIRSHNH